MLSKKLVSSLVVLVFASGGLAQSVYTPSKDSPERKAILNALRIPVEKELKQKIIFSVDHFNILRNWAFVSGSPQSADGGKPNYKGTPYQQAIAADMFDNNFFALLKKTSGQWRVVTREIGCTDVCYATWWRDFKVPKSIFPYTE